MDIKKTFALFKSIDVAEICKPLIDATPVSFFHYFKTYDDGSLVTLTSNGSWLEHYFAKKYYEISSFRGKPSEYRDKYKLTSTFKTSKPIVEDALNYNIGPGIVLVSSKKTFCEFFLFCNDPHYGNSNQFFLNNLEVLEKFSHYFKDKSYFILKEAEECKLHLPKPPMAKSSDISASQQTNLVFNTKRYYIDGSNYLTQKELKCIYWLAQGKTSDEIARILMNSPRTIEKHIEKAKNKLDVHKSVSLVFRAKELGFI